MREELAKQTPNINPDITDGVAGRPSELEFELSHAISMMLARAVDMNAVLQAILDGLLHVVPYDAAGIFLIGEDKKIIESQVVRGYQLEKLQRVRQKVDEGILGWVIAHAQSINVDDVRTVPHYISARSQTLSELVVPIILEDEVIGCINLEADRLSAFKDVNQRILHNLASHAAVAVDRARNHAQVIFARQFERELQIARRIQIALLPGKAPQIPGYDFAGLNVPSQEVGGDYYDFIPITKNDLGLVIADVAGKGIPAGMVMAGLRAALRTRVETTFLMNNVISGVNHFLYDSTGSEAFVTAYYGVLDTSRHRISYINAGHDYPILLSKTGEIKELDRGGPLLGVIKDARYEMGFVDLEPGSILLMYTDGIVEAGAAEGMEFGKDRLIDMLKNLAHESAMVIAREIEKHATEHAPNSNELDDRTVIVVKRL
ncbi:SpoIIE family protein phosphatase [bacterium]|nr:SpoIIE family protein phosphatase [bacterium]